MPAGKGWRICLVAALGLLALVGGDRPLTAWGQAPPTIRDFRLPQSLFRADTAWNQRADGAAVAPDSQARIQVLYRTLLGDRTGLSPPGYGMDYPWPFMDVNYDEYAVPLARSGTGTAPVALLDYLGDPGGVTDKFTVNPDGTIDIPTPAGPVRPSGPTDLGADGHLILFDPETGLMHDLWQATTVRDAQGASLGGGRTGETIQAAGAADYFWADGPGAKPLGYHSATATGVPLMAGLITPEDVESGEIAHALACAIPGLRNTNPGDPYEPFGSDIFYPASLTEGDFYNLNPLSLAAGERLRLKDSLVDVYGLPLDETSLAPITRMFLTALRDYGLYLRDNAGGFTFYAEDIHTAPLSLTLARINQLAGRAEAAPIGEGKTGWQVLMETLNRDLGRIPLGSSSWQEGDDPATAVLETANFEVIAPAQVPSGF